MKVGWRWGAPSALVMILVMNGAASRAHQAERTPESEHRGGGIVVFPTCENTGTCVDPTCDEPGGRYLATEGIVMDTANGFRLWQRSFGPKGDFATAEAYCAALVVQGLGGWRLPTNLETATIVLRPLGIGSRPDACIPAHDQAAFAFPDPTGPLAFWTSTAQPPRPIRYLRDFSDGRSPRTFEDDPEPWVRCVHDPVF
jgi:hypothetical protein